MLRKLSATNTLTTIQKNDGAIYVIDEKLRNYGDHINGYYILLFLKQREENNLNFGIEMSEHNPDSRISFKITQNIEIAATILKEKFPQNPGIENLDEDKNQTPTIAKTNTNA